MSSSNSIHTLKYSFCHKLNGNQISYMMEQGETGGWSEVDRIARVTRVHAQRYANPQAAQNPESRKK